MEVLRERSLAVRGLDMHLVEAGQGEGVLLCHGFPESSWSWRRQLAPLAAAGFHAVAPDLRGYGRTVGPARPDLCDVVSLSDDLVALVHALGWTHCHLVGHDFGALLSWHAAALRPDVFRTVACLSVGFPSFLGGARPPLAILRERTGDAFHYILYFQEPGAAEAELQRDVRGALARMFWASSGEADAADNVTFLPTAAGRTTLLAGSPLPPPGAMPWLGADGLAAQARGFEERGFSGALAWYRAMDLGWERLGPRRAARVEVPALYIVGTRDPVYLATRGLLARMRDAVPRLDGVVELEGCGHWTQQERPREVTAALVDFLARHREEASR